MGVSQRSPQPEVNRPGPTPPLGILRHSRQWSQAELATRAGLARETISRLENGREQPSWETIRKLADALGYPAGILFLTDRATEASRP